MKSKDKLIEGSNHLSRQLTDLEDGSCSQVPCFYCGEPVLPHEQRVPVEGPPLHYECGIRLSKGSVGQQRGECHRRVDPGEAGMTRREAAKAAVEYYLAHHPPAQQ